MLQQEVFKAFWEYIDKDALRKNGKITSLVPNAPQSAIDAFEKYIKIMEEADKKGIIP